MSQKAFSKYCDTRQNDGKIRQVRLAYVADVLTTDALDTDVEDIAPALFLFFDNWLATWTNEDAAIRSFKSSDSNDENGRKPDVSLSIKISEDILPSNFKRFWRQVKRRHLIAETTNCNEVVRIFSPMEISYEYVQPDNFHEAAFYEFFLKPTRLVEYGSSENTSISAILSVIPKCETIELKASTSCLI